MGDTKDIWIPEGIRIEKERILKLIDEIKFSIKDERLMDVCHVHELKQKIQGK